MDESILNDMKQLLGINEDDPSFDKDVRIHTNSVLSVLTQLGVGPAKGFEIQGPENKWSELIGDEIYKGMIRSYMHAKLRLKFDPPQNSFLVAALEKQCTEDEWRISVFTP